MACCTDIADNSHLVVVTRCLVLYFLLAFYCHHIWSTVVKRHQFCQRYKVVQDSPWGRAPPAPPSADQNTVLFFLGCRLPSALELFDLIFEG